MGKIIYILGKHMFIFFCCRRPHQKITYGFPQMVDSLLGRDKKHQKTPSTNSDIPWQDVKLKLNIKLQHELGASSCHTWKSPVGYETAEPLYQLKNIWFIFTKHHQHLQYFRFINIKSLKWMNNGTFTIQISPCFLGLSQLPKAPANFKSSLRFCRAPTDTIGM